MAQVTVTNSPIELFLNDEYEVRIRCASLDEVRQVVVALGVQETESAELMDPEEYERLTGERESEA